MRFIDNINTNKDVSNNNDTKYIVLHDNIDKDLSKKKKKKKKKIDVLEKFRHKNILKDLIDLQKKLLVLLKQNKNFKLVIGHGDLHESNLIYSLDNNKKKKLLLIGLETISL
jgi:hypothetical protein